MKASQFLHQLDHARIVAAIRAAETKTTGELRVFVERGDIAGDPLLVAEKRFVDLGMTKTAARNAILIYVAPRTQKLALVGDEGIHRKCEPEFWQRLVDAMRAHFQREEFTDALVEAIESAGELLARYFPRQMGDRNELPDDILES